MATAYHCGESVAQIAERANISWQAVKRRLSKAGVKFRPPRLATAMAREQGRAWQGLRFYYPGPGQ